MPTIPTVLRLPLRFVVLLLTAVTLPAQQGENGHGSHPNGSHPNGGTATTAVVAPSIGVIGASVSDGFRLADFAGRVRNAEAVAQGYLGRRLKDGEFEARSDSADLMTVLSPGYETALWHRSTDLWMFSSPAAKARQQIDVVRSADCDLIYAVDLPFWFAYGATGVRGRSEEAKAKRLKARTDRFASFLEVVDEQFGDGSQQLILGDIPDLSRARMLITRPQIPTPEERAALNELLLAFAAERDWCHVFGLGAAVDEVRAGIEVRFGERSFIADEGNAFQLALVHPTRLGVCLLAERLLAFAAEVLPERLRPQVVPLADLFQAAGVSEPWTGVPASEEGGEASAEGTSGGRKESEDR